MTFWKTNFNMPVPCVFDGCSNCADGFMDARYCSIGGTSQGLVGFYPGYEVAVADGLYRWETGSGECLNGIARIDLDWYRGATCILGARQQVCIDIGELYINWHEKLFNIGIAGWEICCNGTYCTNAKSVNVSGDDLSISDCNICIDFSPPSTSQCSSALMGSVWVEGNNLNYINANCWEHVITGDCQSAAGASTDGAMWIDNSHYLNWVGADCNVYRAPWRICQFCSTFSNGPPANPSPGAGYAGALWVDSQFGYTHLSYIGCDGNKYLTGAGNCPYIAP